MSDAALRAMLFDLDGSLADTDPLHYQTWRERLAHMSVSRPLRESSAAGAAFIAYPRAPILARLSKPLPA